MMLEVKGPLAVFGRLASGQDVPVPGLESPFSIQSHSRNLPHSSEPGSALLRASGMMTPPPRATARPTKTQRGCCPNIGGLRPEA